jgi:hypothetical protein
MNHEHIIVIFEHFRNLPYKIQQELYKAGSGGEWVHCEIVLPQHEFNRASAWWEGGVKFKSIDKIKNKENYEGFVIPTNYTQDIHDFHVSQVGKKYDKLGLFINMFLGGKNDFKTNWFCSEINFYELKKVAHIQLPNVSPSLVTPMMLRIMLEKLGYKALPLAQLLSNTNIR